MKNLTTRFLALLLCAVLLLPLMCFGTDAQAAAVPKAHGTIIVSLGDSYSSGEGMEPFYGQDKDMSERCSDRDWLAHRSEKSWPGMLTLPMVDGMMREHRNVNWYFAAASGAETKHINRTGDLVPGKDYHYGEHEKPYNRDLVIGTKYLPGQLDIFYDTPGLDRNEVDYVTLTIGGNDLGFTKVLELCHNIGPSKVHDFLTEKLEHFFDEGGVHDQLKMCYVRVHNAAPKATIIVAGYPELLEYSGKGWPFDPAEAADINAAVRMLNKFIEQTVKECDREHDDFQICFVSVEDAFRGHQAYSDDPYIQSIHYGPNDQDLSVLSVASAYSMHPNEKGAAAYAACVQAKINELEGATREVVMVLDASDSMSGDPMQQTKEAAHKFLDTILPENAAVGIVTYSDDATRWCNFSMNAAYLQQGVNDVHTFSSTNIEAGLREAATMLSGDAKNKIIVLMSDGEANRGRTGDDLIAYADELKAQGISIYTLGFFHSLSSKAEPQRVMEGIAGEGHHYEVESAEDLSAFFADMADEINGTKYVYLRAACPVDVRVTSGGETLSSAEDDLCTRTSFGTLTFQDDPDSDDRIKVLRLREDTDYDVFIHGTGDGQMTYTIGYVDDNGDYSDMREIADVPITPDTVIETGVNRYTRTVLEVDNDGDGKVDKRYSATGPNVVEVEEEAPREKTFPVFWVAGIGAAIVGFTVLCIVRIRKSKRRKAENAPRFCGSCGAAIPDDSDFCPECGKRVE